MKQKLKQLSRSLFSLSQSSRISQHQLQNSEFTSRRIAHYQPTPPLGFKSRASGNYFYSNQR